MRGDFQVATPAFAAVYGHAYGMTRLDRQTVVNSQLRLRDLRPGGCNRRLCRLELRLQLRFTLT